MSKTKRDSDTIKLALEWKRLCKKYKDCDSPEWNNIWVEYEKAIKKYPKGRTFLRPDRFDRVDALLERRNKIYNQLKKEFNKELEEIGL